MKKVLFASVASIVALGFESEIEETVTVGGVRYSKAAYEADLERPAGEREIKGTLDKKASADPENQSTTTAGPTLDISGPPLAAPSAPDFNGPADTLEADRIDPLKNAAAPVAHGENARLVLKEGSNYFIVDGSGNKLSKDDLGGVENKFKSDDLAWKVVKDLPH